MQPNFGGLLGFFDDAFSSLYAQFKFIGLMKTDLLTKNCLRPWMNLRNSWGALIILNYIYIIAFCFGCKENSTPAL